MATFDWRPLGSALPIVPNIPTVLNGYLPPTNNNASVNPVVTNGQLLIDFSKTATATQSGGMTATNTAYLLDFKAGQRVKCYLRVITAAGSTCTVDIYTNDGGTNLLFDNVDINATANTRYAANASTGLTSSAPSYERLITADCQLVLLMNNTIAAGKIEIAVEVVQLFAA